jgi:hypothetical protein
MFHSMELVKAIQADRMREMERVLRDRRLLETALGSDKTSTVASSAGRPIQVAAPASRGGSTCELA